MDFLGIFPPLLLFGGIVFLVYYLPFLAKDSKKITDSTEEIKNSLKIITKQNDEIINLLKYKNNED
ncbi:hypothetical protein [Peribacillus alkalitolerans]|uniref:hypothetical protein n=1 Tax=Peribacillus alkalitolerans TaxID=1550385 RepID=UPI0013D664C3|nr:hypothetical protein [Peribacillus alkalitolerans]